MDLQRLRNRFRKRRQAIAESFRALLKPPTPILSAPRMCSSCGLITPRAQRLCLECGAVQAPLR
jgi:hypothetical protein